MKKVFYFGLISTLMFTVLIMISASKQVFAAQETDCTCTSTSQIKGPGCVVGAYFHEDGCFQNAVYKKCEKGAEGSTSTCNCDDDECDDCDPDDMCFETLLN